MKRVIIIIFSFFSFISCNSTKSIIARKILSESKQFIDTVANYKEKINKYYVYTLIGIEYDSANKCHCFSLGYFMDDFEYRNEKTNYYYKIDSNYILVYFNERAIKQNLIKKIGIKEIDKKTEEKILDKLYSTEKTGGVWTYKQRGEIVCISKNSITKQFFNDANKMPFIYRSTKFFGPTIEQHKAGEW